ncbi:hypothetical protein FKW77_008640 [Venturia effusa]|uniref:Uncharacterized protein n=1 Tax=Venturia effusa TaxID=50376 RepID=A0A517L3W2_9PEZI|nr:hypothetical protein FKW77_008640 [Venturia effusa]
MSSTLSGDAPLTLFEYESIGHTANTSMRRSECALRNWPDPTNHPLYEESTELIHSLRYVLEFFCPSPLHLHVYRDWSDYHHSTHLRHVPAIRHLPVKSSTGMDDYLALARQAREELGDTLAYVRVAESSERAVEELTCRHAQRRRQRPDDERSKYRDRVSALQKVAAANRATLLSITREETASAASALCSSTASVPAPPVDPSVVPISVQAFSQILESMDSGSRSGDSISLPTGKSLSTYQATVEDAADDGDA